MTNVGASTRFIFLNNLLVSVFLLCYIVAGVASPLTGKEQHLVRNVVDDSDLVLQSAESHDGKVSSAEARTDNGVISSWKEAVGDKTSESKLDEVQIHVQSESSAATIALQSVTQSAPRRHLQQSAAHANGDRDKTQENGFDIETNIFHSTYSFLMTYQDMLTNLKVYIYPLSKDTEYDFRYQSRDIHAKIRDIRGTDELFFETLAASKFVTADPEEAGLFFIPVSFGALWADFSHDSKRIAQFMRGYVQQLREVYPYWNRTLGTDHVFLSCYNFKADASRNVLELKKNAIQIACSPLAAGGTQDFYPHKDITLPLFEGETNENSLCTSSRQKKTDRKHTLYYAGPVEENSTLASVSESWKSASGFFVSSLISEPSYHQRMYSTSQFCLSLGPSDRMLVLDSLRCGCIPVVLSANSFSDLPFQDILNWLKFSVILNSKDIRKLKRILSAISETQLKSMQAFVLEAAKHMKWKPLSNPYNSFDLAMYELWIRSHTTRYIRRNVK
ncbi:hypothetical protein O6H91_06G076400 [Diphasiastrum complanatum]|uniref:Uncharacterized protein n=1 Tax=Diphasiastrum complanatum TaxID=34168 RepID=A0ACC2DF48_DIPCM|nr:hypothetical protein O6H91_06G076400 [Diphasiastrum complanatum]